MRLFSLNAQFSWGNKTSISERMWVFFSMQSELTEAGAWEPGPWKACEPRRVLLHCSSHSIILVMQCLVAILEARYLWSICYFSVAGCKTGGSLEEFKPTGGKFILWLNCGHFWMVHKVFCKPGSVFPQIGSVQALLKSGVKHML